MAEGKSEGVGPGALPVISLRVKHLPFPGSVFIVEFKAIRPGIRVQEGGSRVTQVVGCLGGPGLSARRAITGGGADALAGGLLLAVPEAGLVFIPDGCPRSGASASKAQCAAHTPCTYGHSFVVKGAGRVRSGDPRSPSIRGKSESCLHRVEGEPVSVGFRESSRSGVQQEPCRVGEGAVPW